MLCPHLGVDLGCGQPLHCLEWRVQVCRGVLHQGVPVRQAHVKQATLDQSRGGRHSGRPLGLCVERILPWTLKHRLKTMPAPATWSRV